MLSHSRRSQTLWRGAGVMAGLGLVLALLHVFGPSAEMRAAEAPPPARREEHVAPPSRQEAVSKVSTQPTAEEEPAEIQPAPAEPPRLRPSVRPTPQRPKGESGPRTVIFDPEPANVTISVDGAGPKPFGPSFRMVELSAGRHTFHFVGAHRCCEDQLVEVDVPAGPGETTVSAKLAFRDARLYVASNVPADIMVDGAQVGRARSLINVPIERSLLERRRISVMATGYQPYTGYVQLRAGEVAQLDVVLTPSAPR